ncbi:exodeoxyribonuclease VII large subunit [Legionella sp. PATHC032]|uniref:exodeoxyribonuclease VII large subunit n=1 Tax=Legionella sp. PATHC032 TaxID=2992039 RepID=UPI001B13BF33|nr:exodeoxyribonuclease VII large subunit [Legionella sp. PATHC032]MCW8420845.1 exodeoxyribonuclease VII large subunit [Legionella sp. PATHC032]HAZ7573988.1 exodeoxyribonuclease VII large subunit [Legionella pneumophila]HBA1634089.1 exodeoxyribonuclease VII large subunit [Legionella pneumophila]
MSSQLPILTVSQLNRQVKGFLENEIGLVHVEGEISNLSKPSSGHCYFTLKDSTAQIRCAFFKNRHSGSVLRNFNDGQQIVASGKLSLYEARGEYQLIVEEIVEAGIGVLYQRFEELKIKLASEGLFNPERKKPLPRIPETIGVITSPTGAAIQDILSTLTRRFPIAKIIIYPSEVQGQTASQQLIKALKLANTHKRCQVLILARGGGSIEDLWAFNDESLARQIAISTIPVVSGIGHETDFTIADFVADYRAETPTAAATAVTPNRIELFNILDTAISRLHDAIIRLLKELQLKLHHLMDKIASPRHTISTYWQTLDYLERQLISAMNQFINLKTNKLNLFLTQLQANNPKTQIERTKTQLRQLIMQLIQEIRIKINQLKNQLSTNLSTLHAVSPLATLDRGYAIVSKNQKILFTTQQAQVGDTIDIRLAQGSLACEVTQIKD